MKFEIVPLAQSQFEQLRTVLDTVAREKRFLAFTEAPPPAEAFAFYRNIVTNDFAAFVAMVGEQIVGWCDVLPALGQARAHVGVLGIGLLPSARHLDIGRSLLQTTIEKAWQKGLSRIELTVRSDNLNAKALFERAGFSTEGLNRRAFLVDGVYYDAYPMSLLR
jgi:ribosomal protein S18 acetylase RimI-like enzyme